MLHATDTSDALALLSRLGVERAEVESGDLKVRTPITGEVIARVPGDVGRGCGCGRSARAVDAFAAWREVPAPRRGELVRLFGEELRREKEALGALVTLEAGKIVQEGLGEVQEMIDICDFAVGLSRQLYGLTIASERPGHRMMETWHPLGPIGVITAFNFPVAVWSWNTALAIVCGDPVIWKPSSQTPLTALACRALFGRAAERFGELPGGLVEVVRGRPGAEPARGPAAAADLGHRVDRDGPGDGAEGGGAPGPHGARAGRQQRHDRRTQRRSRPGRAGDPVRGRRHLRPALHVAPPPDRPRVDRRRPARAAGAGIRQRQRR